MSVATVSVVAAAAAAASTVDVASCCLLLRSGPGRQIPVDDGDKKLSDLVGWLVG